MNRLLSLLIKINIIPQAVASVGPRLRADRVSPTRTVQLSNFARHERKGLLKSPGATASFVFATLAPSMLPAPLPPRRADAPPPPSPPPAAAAAAASEVRT